MANKEELELENEKWARFLYKLWQKEKAKKMKDHENDE